MQPRHTPIQSAIIGSSLDAKLFHTYARLVMASWRHDFQYTDWLTQADLERVLGLDWSNIKRHTAELRRAGLISWTSDGKNGRRFSIVQVRLEEGAKAQYCAPSSSGSSFNSMRITNGPLPLDKAQYCAPALDDVIDRDAWQALRESRIGEPARTRLANLPNVTAAYVKAMAAQARRDGLDTGGLIYRIEHDWPAPELCTQCNGLDGEHSESCPTQAERRAAEAAATQAMMDAHPVEYDQRFDTSAPWEKEPQTDIWFNALEELKLQLPGATFHTWLDRSKLYTVADDIYTIGVHNAYAKDWLENRLNAMIKRTLSGIVGRPIEIKFVTWDRDKREVIE